MMYILLVYIHVFSAILSIGPFFVLIPLLKKLRLAKFEAQQVHLDIFTSAIRIVKHAGHVLVISGILLIIKGSWSWTTPWIVLTVLVMVSSVFFLARAFTPIIIQFADPNHNHEELVNKLERSVWLYIFLLMLMLWFMVAKPVLW